MCSSDFANSTILWLPLLLVLSCRFHLCDAMVVALNTKVCVHPNRVKSFLTAMKQNARQTLAEPGCLQFVLGQQADPASETVFLVHDQFRDETALETHNAMPYFQEFLAITKPMLSAPPQIKKYYCTHEPIERNPTSGFCLNVESLVKPELADEYEELVRRHSALSQAEANCLQFDWGKAAVDEDTDYVAFYFHEAYVDRTSFEFHMVTPHVDRFIDFNMAKEPYVTPQVADFFEIIDYSDEDAD